MTDPVNIHGRRRGRGLRPWLILAKFIGLVGFLGGLAALSAFGLLGPVPEDQAGWVLLRVAVRSIFWPCVFGGLMMTIAAGIVLWLQMPRHFLRMRWFRLKVLLLAVMLPTLHLVARGTVLRMYQAIDVGRMEDAGTLWDRVTFVFLAGLVCMLIVVAIGRTKPRAKRRNA